MYASLARFLLIILLTTVTSSVRAQPTIGRVHCEYTDNPLGIDVPQPRLGWVLESNERGVMQSAYHVLVASTEENLKQDRGDLWDSGKVQSDDSIHVAYAGKPLQSGQRVWWKVRAWDNHDQPSAWSKPAWWEMALLQPGDWTGKWICSDTPVPAKDEDFYADHPAPAFRKEFTAGKKIARARAYVSGLGYYELHINGRRVGDHVLDPGWTTYSKRVLYATYDVTEFLQQGPNAVGAIVGNGWYNPLPLRFWGHINLREHLTIGRPRVILQLNVEYADGTRESIVTDESWKVGDSPILRNNVYLGEIYDARQEQPGWDSPGFNESPGGANAVGGASAASSSSPLSKGGPQGGSSADARSPWRPAALSTEPLGPLQAEFAPPIRITRALKPVAISEPKPGVYIFDLGQNFAGWARLKISGPAGTTVKLRYGELLYPDGTLNVMTSVCGQIKAKGVGGPGAPDVAYQSDTYILKGGVEETYTPRFTFHGFRYVELTGLSAKPPLDTIEGLRLNSDVRQVGTFECSDPLFNRIHEVFQWTLLSNMFSVQSDCPHREKLGYGGDIVACSEAAMFNYDMSQFYAKTVRDYQDAARPNGGLTETAPFVGIADEGFGEGTGPIEWGTAHPLLLYQLLQYYGNRRLIEEQYDTAKRWVDFLSAHAKDNMIETGISDHESLVPKPTPITGTGFYFMNLELQSQLALWGGKSDQYHQYDALAKQVREASNAKYLHSTDGAYSADGKINQCAQSIGIYLNLIVPTEDYLRAFGVLVDDLSKHDHHLTTGIFGTKFLLKALSVCERPDLAYAMVSQKTYPGWGYMLERGATTLWEHWAYDDNTFSQNHPMFGSVDEWFFTTVAGIAIEPPSPGTFMFRMKPRPGGGLTWVKAEYDSIHGKVRTEWHQVGQVFTLDVTIPANAKARIDLPMPPASQFTESGRPVEAARISGTAFPGAHGQGSFVSVDVGSGEYHFRIGP